MKTAERPKTDVISRRQFLKKSSATAASLTALTASIQPNIYAAGTEAIKIGLIGCGGRGTGAAVQALNACKRAKLMAMADAFEDRLEQSYRSIRKIDAERVDVPPERRFTGMDAYAKVIEADVEMVLLTTPPGFRPLHFEAAVEADKHVFLEKPVAVDAPGVRRMLAANKRAKQKKLAVAVGLNIRHQNNTREVIKRVPRRGNRQDNVSAGLREQRGCMGAAAPGRPERDGVPDAQLVLLQLALRRLDR